MKKLTAIICVLVVLGLSSCSRDERENKGARNPDAPEWLYDESLAVPISFGVGTVVSASTKADFSVEPDPDGYFTGDNFRYGVYANCSEGEHPSVNGVEARNVPTSLVMDGIAGYKTQFVGEIDASGTEIEKTHYYPVKSDRNYTFYAYHITNLLDKHNRTDNPIVNGKISDIPLGDCDIVYAKAEAVEFQGQAGYNAAYIRALMSYGGTYHYLESSYAPHFQFNHLTARFRFWVQAVDDVDGSYAEETMDGKVKITGIRVSKVKKSAVLDIVNGTLSGEVDRTDDAKNTLSVNRDETSPFYPKRTGGYWGDPLFILPNDLTEPGYVMTLTIQYLNPSPESTPEDWKTAEYSLELVNKVDGRPAAFKAGVSYNFHINLQSYESIEISTSVSPWEDAPYDPDDDFVIG